MLKIKPGTRVVILTGAGISAESGIDTFRASDGLWGNHAIEDVATPFAWQKDPQMVWNFYQGRRKQLLKVKQNPAHEALVKLEQHVGEEFLLITQNVDDLHDRAGSKNLIHMHGELRKLRCEKCHGIFEMMEEKHLTDDHVTCPDCENDRLRPHIVWFYEMPFKMEEIYQAVENCEIFMTIGTSGHVSPASDLIYLASSCGATCVGINLDKPVNFDGHDQFHQGKAGELLPELVEKWLA